MRPEKPPFQPPLTSSQNLLDERQLKIQRNGSGTIMAIPRMVPDRSGSSQNPFVDGISYDFVDHRSDFFGVLEEVEMVEAEVDLWLDL